METPTRIPNSDILRLIAKGYLSSQIAQELHISKAAVFKRINHLVKLEYIHTEKKGIIKQLSLTAKGLAELNSVGVTQESQPSPQKPRGATRVNPQKVNSSPSRRLHDLGLKYQLVEPLKPSEPILLLSEHKDIDFTPITLNNNAQAMIHAEVTIKLTTTSLILYAPALYYSRGQPSIVAEAQAKAILDPIAQEWEQRLNIRLVREKLGVLHTELITEESADENHPLAQQAAPEHKVVLARTPDGDERLIADRSPRKFAEAEAVYHRTAAEDSDTIDKQFNAILDGKINLLDMDYYLNRLAQSQAELGNSLLATQKQNEFFSKTFIEHERAYTEMKNSSIENQKTSRMLQADIKHFGALLDKLDRVLSQRKLNEYR